MKAYFQDRGRQAALLQEAQEWYGTPFMAHAQAKGVGVDCVRLAAGLYLGTGLLHDFKPGRYEMDGGQHNTHSLVTGWLETSPHFARAEMPLMVGDLLCFRMGRNIHHVGVVLTERTFVHVCQGYRVREAWIDDTTWSKRLAAIYRPITKDEALISQLPQAMVPTGQPLMVPLVKNDIMERLSV